MPASAVLLTPFPPPSCLLSHLSLLILHLLIHPLSLRLLPHPTVVVCWCARDHEARLGVRTVGVGGGAEGLEWVRG